MRTLRVHRHISHHLVSWIGGSTQDANLSHVSHRLAPRLCVLNPMFFISVWAIDTACTDWLIAGTLIWTLYKIRTTINGTRGTVKMLTRLIHISGLCGAAPAVLAVLTCKPIA